MSRLIHTGSVIIDQVMQVPKMPEPGGDVVARSATSVVGGGYNTIVAAVRDGMSVTYAGLIGTGENGDRVVSSLSQHQVEIALPRHGDLDTGYCVAVVEDDGERTFFTYVGSEGLLSFEMLDSLQIQPGDFVYVTGYSMADPVNAEGLRRWLPTLPDQAIVFVDPSPLIGDLEPDDVSALLAHADLFSTNARETKLLGGSEDFATAAASLRMKLKPSCTLLARDGARGTWLSINQDEPGQWIDSFPVDVVDTNGAGDAHAGVLLSGLSRGLEIEYAVRRANAAAALSVTKSGPATSPTAMQIDAFMTDQSKS